MATQLVLLGPHSVCHTVSAATDKEHLKSGVTAFLRWKAFEHLAALGYAGNDLTDAQLNPVTHFKSQLGGDLHMNLILSRPDGGRFRLQKLAHRAGSFAKRGVKVLLSPSSRARKNSPANPA
jgi:hypothetical protein